MPDPREITDVAIDSALHRLPEPGNGWRAQVPPEDLGAMVDAGSGQITLQALIALLWYGTPQQRAFATRALHRYADLCWSRWMLSEPWSDIYGRAIVCCWLAVVLIAERISDATLAARFRELLRGYAATARLMEARALGKVWLLAAGCRSWGHAPTTSGLTAGWRVASGRAQPPEVGGRAYGQPGAYDDWGWLHRAERLGLSTLRAAVAPYPEGMAIETLLGAAPRWAARTEMQLLGWPDGSRLWLMGDDEAELDDEDSNSNTPGWLAAGVLGGQLVILPRWPNPIDGLERLRQTNSRADLDGGPERGWTLWHSALGERRGAHPASGAAGYVSTLPPYTTAPLLFHVGILAGDRTWRQLHPGAGAPVAPSPKTPTVPSDPPPGSPRDEPAGFELTTRWLASERAHLLVAKTATPVEIVPIHPEPAAGELQRWLVRRAGGG